MSLFVKTETMGASTLARGLDVLEAFKSDRAELSIPEIARRTGLTTGTAYRYAATLKSRGFIQESRTRGRYRLGMGVLELARVVSLQVDLIPASLPSMRRLAEETKETVLLAAIHQSKGICLERVESRHALRVTWERGSTFHLHAGATGKVLLACLDEGKLSIFLDGGKLPQLTKKTVTDPRKLREDLALIQTRGFCISEGEETPGIRAIAAPVIDTGGDMPASLTVGGPAQRLTKRISNGIAGLLIEEAERISQGLSFRSTGQGDG